MMLQELNEASYHNQPHIMYYVIYNLNAPEIHDSSHSSSSGPFLTRSEELIGYHSPRTTFDTEDEAKKTLNQWKRWANKKHETAEWVIKDHKNRHKPGKTWNWKKGDRNPYDHDVQMIQSAQIGAVGILPR